MLTKPTPLGGAVRTVTSGVLLLALVSVGIVGLLLFWGKLLKPGELSSVSLPVVAFVAGVAATFNPCALPALPGLLSFSGGIGGGSISVRRRLVLCLATCLGAMVMIVIFGIMVAIVGAGAKTVIAPHFRWVQLAVGLLLVGFAVLHLMGQTTRLPLVGPIMGLGSRMWERAMGRPTAGSSCLFGAGYVAVGAG